MISKASLFVFLLTLSALGAWASVKPTAPLLFRTLGVGVDTTELVYLDNAKPQPVTIDSQRRSTYFEYSSPGVPIVFARVVQGPDGKEQRLPVAQATVDASIRRALLIFIRGKSSEQPLDVIILKDDISAVPAGGYRILNFLPVPAGIRAGNARQVINPRDSATMNPEPLDGRSVYEFKVFGLVNDAAIPLFSNIYSVDTTIRQLVLIVPSPSSPKQMEVKFLGESVNAIKPDDPLPSASPPPR